MLLIGLLSQHELVMPRTAASHVLAFLQTLLQKQLVSTCAAATQEGNPFHSSGHPGAPGKVSKATIRESVGGEQC